MSNILNVILSEVKKTKYPFQKEEEFLSYEEITTMQDGREFTEHVIKFPASSTLLTDMPLRGTHGLVIVQFPKWTEMNKIGYEYLDAKTKHDSIVLAVRTIVKNEMDWM
jgi:hypothetical protein